MDSIKERVSILEVKMDSLHSDTSGYDARFDRIDERFDHLNAEIVTIHGRFSDLEARITDMGAGLEARMTDMGTGLEARMTDMGMGLEARITDMGGRLEARITDVHKSITSQTRWMVGIMGSLSVAFIGVMYTALIKLGPVFNAIAESMNR